MIRSCAVLLLLSTSSLLSLASGPARPRADGSEERGFHSGGQGRSGKGSRLAARRLGLRAQPCLLTATASLMSAMPPGA